MNNHQVSVTFTNGSMIPYVRVNLRTTTHGGSSMVVVRKDGVEVYHGNLNTCVSFEKHGIKWDVEMDTWKNDPREMLVASIVKMTYELLMSNLTFEHMSKIITQTFNAGKKEGREELRVQFVDMLGLS